MLAKASVVLEDLLTGVTAALVFVSKPLGFIIWGEEDLATSDAASVDAGSGSEAAVSLTGILTVPVDCVGGVGGGVSVTTGTGFFASEMLLLVASIEVDPVDCSSS